MESECFICSLKSYDFDRFGKGFVYHIKHEHNMWCGRTAGAGAGRASGANSFARRRGGCPGTTYTL
jgi:hypothetical protein